MSEVKSAQMDAAVQMMQMNTNLLVETGLDKIGRSFVLTGEIDEDMFQRVDAFMNLLELEGKATVTVRLNCGGGSVYSTMAIIGRLRASKCKIVTEGYGLVASGAFNILACGHKRRISPLAAVMHHEVAFYDIGSQKLSELEALTKQSKREERIRAELMAKFTNQPAEFWLSEGSKIDRYFSTQELLDFGVIDEVIKL